MLFSFIDRYANLFISIVSTIVLARMLTPVETGLYSIAAGFINVAQALREFGASAYILQEKELTREKIASVTGVCLLIGGTLTLFFYGTSSWIADFYDSPRLTVIIRVLSLNFITVAFSSVGGAQLRRAMMFRASMYIGFASNAAGAIASISCAASGLGAISLAWGSLAGIAVTVIGNGIALGRREFVWPNLRYWRELAHFGVYSSAAGLLGALADRTPDLVVGRTIGLEGAGLFSRGKGLITLFRTALTSAIDPVIGSSFAMLHREDEDVLSPILRVINLVSGLAWPALAVMIVLAHPIITIVFGPKWLGSVGVSQILCIGAALSLIGNICQTYLGSTGAVRSTFIIQAISVPVYVSAVIIGSLYSLTGAALGEVVTGFLMTGVSVHMVGRRINLTWWGLLPAVLPSLAISLIAAAPALLVTVTLGMDGEHPLLPFLLAGFSAGLAWLGGLYLLRHPLWPEVVRAAATTLRRRPPKDAASNKP